ncbi:MAG TPA: hypothetical protein VLT61_06030 [Anaeromyxobacteraceae bacterium]|nr:hypothetical protein [Anaeromyxobacteraceae bacterium]
MNRRLAATLPALALALLLAPAAARADERPFAFTYEARTEAAGETELELYETFYAPHSGGRDARSWVHQLELGRGLTERSDVALYTVFRSTSANAFELDAMKLRGRYRLFMNGEAPVDVVLYLEAEKELVDDQPWAIEEKLILGRDFGRVSFAVNLRAEQEFPKDAAVERKYGWSGGVAARIADGFKLGVESVGELKDGATATWLGPSALVALPFLARGPFMSSWLTVGVGFGLNEHSDDVRARALVGADF